MTSQPDAQLSTTGEQGGGRLGFHHRHVGLLEASLVSSLVCSKTMAVVVYSFRFLLFDVGRADLELVHARIGGAAG